MGLERTCSKIFLQAHPGLLSLIHETIHNRCFQHKSHIGYGVAVTFTTLMNVQTFKGLVRPGFDSPYPRVLFAFFFVMVSKAGGCFFYSFFFILALVACLPWLSTVIRDASACLMKDTAGVVGHLELLLNISISRGTGGLGRQNFAQHCCGCA